MARKDKGQESVIQKGNVRQRVCEIGPSVGGDAGARVRAEGEQRACQARRTQWDEEEKRRHELLD